MSHRISYTVGFTANLGDFQSLRVDLGLELDGKGEDTPRDTLVKVRRFVEKELETALDEVKGSVASTIEGD